MRERQDSQETKVPLDSLVCEDLQGPLDLQVSVEHREPMVHQETQELPVLQDLLDPPVPVVFLVLQDSLDPLETLVLQAPRV